MEFHSGLAREILEEFPMSLAVLDGEGTIRWVNQTWREFGAANGLSSAGFGVGEAYLDAITEAYDSYAADASEGIAAVLAGERDTFTMEYPCHGPEELRWFEMYAVAVVVDDTRYCVVGHTDNTEAKLADLLTDARRLEVATLTQMIWHDIRNGLGIVDGWLRELESTPEERERLRPVLDALARMEDALDESTGLLRQAQQRPNYASVPVSDLVEAAWRHAGGDPESLDVVDEFPVLCYPRETKQLLFALFENAIEADSGTVRVSLGEKEFYVDDDRDQPLPDPPESVFAVETVRHDGRYEVGLTLVRPLALMQGWSVSVSDAPTGGWRFTVRTEQVHE